MLRSGVVATLAVTGLADLFCPGQEDFNFGGGPGTHWEGSGGWTLHSWAGVHGKQTFDLRNGYIEFDYDTTHGQSCINNNFYLTAPEPSWFRGGDDCDIQAKGKRGCMELDVIEMNGNCLAQTTWHTWGNNNGDCDKGGCWGQMRRSGKSHIKVTFAWDGWMQVWIDGRKVEVNRPWPSTNAKDYVGETMKRVGVAIQSTQWRGWVPGNCGGCGPVEGSSFSITNLRVEGRVVQHLGRMPPRCPSANASLGLPSILDNASELVVV
jgi:hypothetical protein